MSVEQAKPSEIGKIDIGKRVVNFIGPEGSGKSTIAKMLAQNSEKPLLSVGDILRHFAANDQGIFGETAREMFAKRAYFMDRKMLLDMYAERFKSEDLKDGFVLEGAMRDTIEVNGFGDALNRAGIGDLPVSVVFLRIPGWLGVDRLGSDPTKRGRSDDNAEAVVERMSHYYDHLGERASMIRNNPNWQYINIDGKPEIPVVYGNVVEVLIPAQ